MTTLQSFADALNFAAKWHGATLRKSETPSPFLHHPIRVASRLMDHGFSDPSLLQAALLHDVLEDTECGEDRMHDTFGPEVTGIVLEVTDDKHLLKQVRKQHQVERALYLSENARLIRIADKIDNVGELMVAPPRGWSPVRCRVYVRWAQRVIEPIKGTHPGLERDFSEIRTQAMVRWST